MERSCSQTTMAKEGGLAEERALAEDECSKIQSPCLSEFEEFLDKCDAQRQQVLKDDIACEGCCADATDHAPKPEISARQRTDDWWERATGNVAIVDTLSRKAKNLSLLAMAASTKRMKKTPASRWTYETVAEPTGMVSKYWDSPAPLERATKRVAKQKLCELHLAVPVDEGIN
jgi:hypothetical protein